VEVKSRRVGGATFQVPIEVRQERKVSLSMKNMIKFAYVISNFNEIDRFSEMSFQNTSPANYRILWNVESNPMGYKCINIPEKEKKQGKLKILPGLSMPHRTDS
jgi:hypothetical protein